MIIFVAILIASVALAKEDLQLPFFHSLDGQTHLDLLLHKGDEYAPNRFRRSLHHTLEDGHSVHLEYDVEHAQNTHTIHDETHGIVSAECSAHEVHLRFRTPELAAAFAVEHGEHLVGDLKCGDAAHVRSSLMRRVVSTKRTGNAVVFGTEELGITDVFKNAHVDFRTTKLPSVHTPPAKDAPVVSHATRGTLVGDWIKSTWGDVKHLEDKVEEIVGDITVSDILDAVQGKFAVNQTYNRALIDFNFNAATQKAKGKFNLSAALSCDNCYAKVDVGVYLILNITDFHLYNFDSGAYGRALVGMGASAQVKAEAHVSYDVGTFSAPPISFVIGAVPVVIKFTVPLAVGADMLVELDNTNLKQAVEGSAQIRAGINYKNGQFHPYSEFPMSYTSARPTTMVHGKAQATGWVRPVVVAKINFIGGPSLTFRGYATATADSSQCDKSDASKSTALFTTNAGLQAVVGCALDIKIAKEQIVHKAMRPVTCLSRAWPIDNMCLFVRLGKRDETPNMTSVTFSEGCMWEGTQVLVNQSPECVASYPVKVDYSLQLVRVFNSTMGVYVLAGNADNQVTPDPDDFCVFQQLVLGRRGPNGLDLVRFVDDYEMDLGVNYFSCGVDNPFPVKPTHESYITNDGGFTLEGVNRDGCVVTKLTAGK